MKYLFIRKMSGFIKRDFMLSVNYRFAFVMQFVVIFADIMLSYFVARLFGSSVAPYLKDYKGDYFSYVLIGMAFAHFFNTGINTFPNKISEAQTGGNMEAMLCTTTSASVIIVFSSLWSFIFSAIQVLMYFILGTLFFKANVIWADFILIFATFSLTILSVSGVGIIMASMKIAFKNVGHMAAIAIYGFQLFGGVFFPVELLPDWLQVISRMLPITYSLRIMRGILIQRLPLYKLTPDFAALIVFTAILLFIGLVTFAYVIKKAKMDGDLTTF